MVTKPIGGGTRASGERVLISRCLPGSLLRAESKGPAPGRQLQDRWAHETTPYTHTLGQESLWVRVLLGERRPMSSTSLGQYLSAGSRPPPKP